MRVTSLKSMALATAGVAALVLVASVAGVGSGAAATQAPPRNQSPPQILGNPNEASTLTATDGEWAGTAPIRFTYSWRRCDENGGSCSAISGATSKTYALKAVDVANTLRVRVTARNAEGADNATSVPTAVIKAAPKPAPAPATGCPDGSGTIQADQLSSPARLLIDRQSIEPSVVGRSATGLRVRYHVSACGGRSVQGVLVYVTAVPYNQFSVPSEQQTGSDGWAELTMQRLGGFPAARSQQLLVMFVRARKSNENPLAGVSTRRLVSFRVDLSR